MDARTETRTPTAAEMVARTRAMIPALRKRAAQGERDRRIAKETIAEMQEAGLFRVLQPKRWDGYELPIGTYFDVEMALAEGDMSVAWVYGVVGTHPWGLSLFDDRAADDVWGKDRSVLISSSLMPSGTAMPEPGGYRVQGRWRYSSGCEHCDWAFLGATVGGAQGGYADRCLFLIPRKDYEIVDTWHVSGLKGTGSHDIEVKGAFVPAHRMIRYSDNFKGVAPGLAVNTAPLYRLPWGQVFFRGVNTASIGALQGMLDIFLDYGKSRVNRMFGTKAFDDPTIQLTCAEVAVGLDEMKTMLHHKLRILEGYAARGEMPPYPERIHMKFHSATAADRCVTLATKLFRAAGAAGIYADMPFGRILADITAARQHVSNQYETIGRNAGAAMFGAEETRDFSL
jgi:3-hydroxy-9,10-secoandrosta-1,3,5(10)-triene-9,17-dione monooxygenase